MKLPSRTASAAEDMSADCCICYAYHLNHDLQPKSGRGNTSTTAMSMCLFAKAMLHGILQASAGRTWQLIVASC